MEYTFKNWNSNDFYNFNIEFNRIESYNEYCREWLQYYGINIVITNKTNWTINDIVDLQDYNRVKNNINTILSALNISGNQLTISSQYNQSFNEEKANEIEKKLKAYLSYLGNLQFAYNISGLTTTGNSLKLNGVM